MRSFLILLVAAVAAPILMGSARAQSTSSSVYGDLEVDNRRVEWPAPELIARDLHAANDAVRLQAFHLLGLEDESIYRHHWSQTQPSHVDGEQLLLPDLVQLTYAAMGEGADQQAIIAI